MNLLNYKDYYGSIEYSEEDKCLHGKVIGLEDGLILYEGNTVEELEQDFREGVDRFLESCKRQNLTPTKSKIVDIHISVPVNVFEKLNTLADNAGLSLNAYMVEKNPVAI